MTGAGVEGFEAEVVENEQIGAAEGFDEARMAAVASGEREIRLVTTKGKSQAALERRAASAADRKLPSNEEAGRDFRAGSNRRTR